MVLLLLQKGQLFHLSVHLLSRQVFHSAGRKQQYTFVSIAALSLVVQTQA
jgi:hypothetical protein